MFRHALHYRSRLIRWTFQMRRRELILGTLAGLGAPWIPGAPAHARAGGIGAERWRIARRQFPCKLVETSGADALATWERLKRDGQGIPVVVGSARDVAVLSDRLELQRRAGDHDRSAGEIIAKAARLRHPPEFWAMRQKRYVPARILTDTLTQKGRIRVHQTGRREHFVDGKGREMPGECGMPMVASDASGLTVATDYQTGAPLDTVFIALVPADDPATVAAHLRFGGWHGNPGPEYHVAALQSWHERYGAEIVGVTADTMNVRVRNRPRTCEEAIALAREHNDYCGDVLGGDTEDLLYLAAMLMETDWWFFWWD
jgi:hypothetical protein